MQDLVFYALLKREKLLINCGDKESSLEAYHLVLSEIEELFPNIVLSAYTNPHIRITIANGSEIRFVHKDSDMCGVSFDREITYER